MSLQWTFIATFLYIEIFVAVLLLLPIISAYRWSKIFNSRMLSSFQSHANIYFNIFIFILLILFCDAIREVRKYSSADDFDLNTNPNAEVLIHMKLFRSQRNFYIAGFALFLFLVLRRLVTLLCDKAQKEAQLEAMQKQAESASAAARKLLEDSENKANEKEEKSAVLAELETVKKEMSKVREEAEKAKKDLVAIKKQAESTNAEYDRLAEENRKLQQKCQTLEGQSGSKKGD